MTECKPVATPAVPGQQLVKATEEEHQSFMETNYPYRQVVGSLIYLMVATRPDISYTITKLSQYLDKPSLNHVTAAKRVLRYLKGTPDYALLFNTTDENLCGYSNSDWAGSSDDRRSTSGFTFSLGGAPISWKSN